MNRRLICWALVAAMVAGLCGIAHAQNDRVSALELYLTQRNCQEEELRFALVVYEAALTQDGIDISKLVDEIVNRPDEAESAWLAMINMLRFDDLEDAYWTEMIVRKEDFASGSYHANQIEEEIKEREDRAQVEAVRAWLAPQEIAFPGFVELKDGDMLIIFDALLARPEAEQAEWYHKVITALQVERINGHFFDEVVPVLCADAQLAPSLRQWMLLDYIDCLIGMVYNNTQFYGETERAQPIFESLTRAAHPDFPVDYEGLVVALEALNASDMDLIYPQLDRITSLIGGKYAMLLDAYANSAGAEPGAPLYDLLMAERTNKLEQPSWTPEDLKLFYHAAFPEDVAPEYAPKGPVPNQVLVICPEESRDAAQALLDALEGAGLELTSDPDLASFALIYQLTHGRGGEYSAGSRFIIAQSTTATLIFASWSATPTEHARVSEINQPGDVIEVPQGALTYAAPASDLRSSKNWESFVKKVKAAVK